jgi:tetratricopeptide (TPR) repeat protein
MLNNYKEKFGTDYLYNLCDGLQFILCNRLKLAMESFTRSLEFSKNDLTALNFIGIIYFLQNDYNSALVHYYEVLKLGNEEVILRNSLVTILYSIYHQHRSVYNYSTISYNLQKAQDSIIDYILSIPTADNSFSEEIKKCISEVLEFKTDYLITPGKYFISFNDDILDRALIRNYQENFSRIISSTVIERKT